ncbi:MAG: hypothetical protein WBX25_35735 [Rhodomicrobium sp.]
MHETSDDQNGEKPSRLPPFEGEGGRPIDHGIRHEVQILWENGIETTESCEGGSGHSFHEPTVRFRGDKAEGFRALAIALQNGLKVSELRRYWSIEDGEPVGPEWEMTFVR